MMNFLARIMFAASLALTVSKSVTNLMFEDGTYSFLLAFVGMGILFVPFFYSSLSNTFATKLVIVSKDEFEKRMEQEMKKLKDKSEE